MLYRIDIGKGTLREFWWDAGLLFWVGLVVKVFRIHVRGSTDDLPTDSIAPFRADADQIAADELARFAPSMEKLRGLGFGGPIWYAHEDAYQATRNTIAVLRHDSGRSFAWVQRRVNLGRVPAKVKFFTTFISAVPGGYVVTGNGKYDMEWPDSHDTVRFRRLPAVDVWARHQDRMTAGVQTIDPFELPFAAEAYHESLASFHVARGMFVPLTPEELAASRTVAESAPLALAVAAPPADTGEAASSAAQIPDYATSTGPSLATELSRLPAPDLMERAVLDELRRLQTRAVNWTQFVFLLALSGLLFVLHSRGGSEKESWQDLAIIVGVLLFHESGHYVAMKVFGYRNLRMFFLPGLGAAVSGEHYNAPGWKKIVVSLMGPLPGILVGTGLMVAYAVTRNDWLFRISLFALVINALNLIPLLPLDGGRVAHAALFIRHPKLDVGFRITASLLLIAAGIWLPGMKYLMYLSIAGLLAVPMAYMVASIVSELRPVADLGASPDSQSIPADTARIILARLRQRVKRNLNVKMAAQHVANVFESLNARPPSVGATLGLLTAQGAGFVIALLVLIVGVVVHNPNLLRRQPGLGPMGINSQMLPVTPNQIVTRGARPTGPLNTVVIQFKTEAAAIDAASATPSSRPLTRFGQCLFVGFTPQESVEQSALFDRYEKSAAAMFVETANLHGSVDLSFTLPATDQGRQAFKELQAYLEEARFGITPPWATEADWPATQRQKQTVTRQLLVDLREMPGPDPVALRQRLDAIALAQRHGDTVQVDRLRAELKNANEQAASEHRQHLQQQYGQPELIAAYAKAMDEKNFKNSDADLKRDIIPALGLWPADRPRDTLVSSGYVFEMKTSDHLNCRFDNTPVGLLQLTHWLFDHGATNVQYVITSTAVPDGIDDELPD